jgi:uncharacterized phage-like protein YoqJ
MIVSFTGHRPDKLGGYRVPNPVYRHVCQQIEKALTELQPEKVISGMALGVDQWAAYIAYKMKIPFVAAIPFEGQESAWPLQSQQTYKKLVKLASEQVIVSPGRYASNKMQVRNEWMVDQCDKLIAVYNGDISGGTFNCIKYAQGIKKDIYYIDPKLPIV